MQLDYSATDRVSAAIAALGRTEDVRFSPDNLRLAVTSFLKNTISVFAISLDAASPGKPVTITDVLEISSPSLKNPHGVDFIDDETIMVANRSGDACIFRLPPQASGDADLRPLETIRSGDVISTPGSVAVTKRRDGRYEALLCNNYANTISSHLMDLTRTPIVEQSAVLLERWLAVPDGVSAVGEWIAVSNHDSNRVLLYDRRSGLSDRSNPNGVLRCMKYPHGLRFTRDGRFILVADAGAPYVHIYGNGTSDWHGMHSPLTSIRIMTNEKFLRGQANPEEGGPKGLDVDSSTSILVTTCETMPLAFFNLEEILSRLPRSRDG